MTRSKGVVTAAHLRERESRRWVSKGTEIECASDLMQRYVRAGHVDPKSVKVVPEEAAPVKKKKTEEPEEPRMAELPPFTEDKALTPELDEK